MELAGYFIKVTGCLTGFIIIYSFWLSKLTFFSLNRFYLLVSLIFSFSIPLLHFEYKKFEFIETVEPLAEVRMESADIADPENDIAGSSQGEIRWIEIITYSYFLVSFLLLAQLIRRVARICRHAGKNGIWQDGVILAPPMQGLANCSFFNIIFIDREALISAESEYVLAHEREHIRRFHSADKLLAELACVVLWFNPFVYYLRRLLAQVHEFEADAAMSSRFNKRQYADLLLKLSSPGLSAFVNSFSKSELEVRFNMLFSHKSSKMKKLIYLSLFPAIAVMGFCFSVQVVHAKVYKTVKHDPEKNLPDNAGTKTGPGSPGSYQAETSVAYDAVSEKATSGIIKEAFPAMPGERKKLTGLTVEYKSIKPSGSADINNELIRFTRVSGPEKSLRVVLDPGHGGKDDQTRVSGIYEKDLTLEVAKEIRKSLQERGFEVILTRETDEFVPLYTRAGTEGDIFISLHANSVPSGETARNGMEIILGSTMDKGSQLLNQSTRLAKVFHNELRKIDGVKLNEVIIKQSLAVLRANVSPAILVELGYMTNPSDLKFMTDKAGQKKIGDAFAEAITAYQ